MRYYLIAGEPSGDLHGANLIAGIKKHDPNASFRFWGGDKMASKAGDESLAKHYKENSFFGLTQVIMNLGKISHQMKECKEDIIRFNPDVVILIDYPGFNFRIAKFAKQNGFKTFYYISPKVWAWKESRVKLIKKYVDQLFIIFPFEVEYFQNKGIKATYEGNPLVDAIDQQRAKMPSKEVLCREFGIDPNKKIIALLAGSRSNEIKNNLPFMSAVAQRMTDCQFVVAGVSWLDRTLYDSALENSSITYLNDKTYELLNIADGAIVTSGTATLETALIGVPEIVCYRIDPITYFFANKLVKIRLYSLVNIVMGREVVKELIQQNMTVDNAVNQLTAIIKGGSKHDKLASDYAELHKIIGGVGASERFAKQMVNILKKE